jgi:hypothetical protein
MSGATNVINQPERHKPIQATVCCQFIVAEYVFSMAQQSLVVQDFLIVEASRSHTLDTPHSAGLLWTSDQPVPETSI